MWILTVNWKIQRNAIIHWLAEREGGASLREFTTGYVIKKASATAVVIRIDHYWKGFIDWFDTIGQFPAL